jgi:hypothetical protein
MARCSAGGVRGVALDIPAQLGRGRFGQSPATIFSARLQRTNASGIRPCFQGDVAERLKAAVC